MSFPSSFSELLNEQYTDFNKSKLNSNLLSKLYTKENCLLLPFLHIGGVLGYAVCLPLRILRVVKEILMLIAMAIYHLVKRNPESLINLKVRVITSLLSLLQLGNNFFGLILPYYAYKIDQYVQSFDVFNNTNFWPYQELGSIWYDDTGMKVYTTKLPEIIRIPGLL